MNLQDIQSISILNSSHRDSVIRILSAGLNAADPQKAVERSFQRTDTIVKIGIHEYDLESYDRVFMIGFGKASIKMGNTVADILGDYLTKGILISKVKSSIDHRFTEYLQGAHPVPDKRSLLAAQTIVELLKTTTEQDLVICLISGGGSALLTLPVHGISLEDIQLLTNILLECGASINEINSLRKHISQFKGGGLAKLAAPAQLATLILSDVVDDPLDIIASGPTVPDPSTYSDAIKILKSYQIWDETPEQILTHLQSGQSLKFPDTPKKGDPIFRNVKNFIIGNNYLASRAALNQAGTEGFNTILLTTSLQGEARHAGKFLASVAKQVAASSEPIPRPACVIAGGETTVTLRGGGKGGRNQEMALGAVKDISNISDMMLITIATDGEDGPTDAAGAVVTGETFDNAIQIGLDPEEYLAKNDSYKFFDQLNDLLRLGMTGTNVNDLALLMLF